MADSQFIDWYKQRSKVDIVNKQKREIRENRRNNRTNLLMEKRGINIEESPKVEEKIEKKDPKELRLMALKEWKEKRNKEKIEKQLNKKPIFKVHHISVEIGAPDLEYVNKTIKGKRFDTKLNKTKKLKPSKRVITTTMGFEVTKECSPGISARLRSKTKGVQNVLEATNSEKREVVNKKSKNNKDVPKIEDNINENDIEENPDGKVQEQVDYRSPVKRLSERISNFSTPVNQELANAYVSPFVTISRGKSSARKEYKLRRSQGGLFDVSDHLAAVTGNQAAAAHFHQLLNDEIARIEKMCDDWLKYKDENQPPEEACDMINTAIGQSKLLINKKFQQFRGLIVDCEISNSERPVTCSDLHGYWEMMCLQVDNVNKRFENLEKLCSNNWEEIVPVVKKPQQKKKVVKKGAKPRVQSTLRDLIKAKRLQVKEEMETNENIAPSPSVPDTRVHRKSLRISLRSNDVKSHSSTPSLIMIKTKSSQKQYRKTISADSTPAKSILKTPNPNTTSRKKKLVLFRSDAVDIESPPLLLNGSRRSSRRASKKLQPEI